MKKRLRHEYKYRINSIQREILLVKARGLLIKDAHTNKEGSYIVNSLYFDDSADSCYYENLAGTDPRSKYRIRYYNSDLSYIQLEKKTKIRGLCLKESCLISVDECSSIINGQIPVITEDMPEQKKKMFSEIMIRRLFPKVIVSYKRIPFIYPAGNVRVTFDDCITSSTQINQFLNPEYLQRPVMPAGELILEIKWDELLPKHLIDVLRIEGLSRTNFSKYCICRMLPV